MIRKIQKSPENPERTKNPKLPMRKAESLRKKAPGKTTALKKNLMKSPKTVPMKMKRNLKRKSPQRRQKRNPESPTAA